MEQESETILTAVRVKPPDSHSHSSLFKITPTTLSINDHFRQRQYSADRVFPYETTQAQIFQYVKPQLAKHLEGYNCTIMAYGMTGSGKTYTMFGDGILEDRGLIPRIIEYILQGSFQKQIFISCIELYQQKIYDLLNATGSPLIIHQYPQEGVIVEGLAEFEVQSLHQALHQVQRSHSYRSTRKTHQNDRSSRSHAIFQITSQSQEADHLKKAKLSLCDLAGSQKIHKGQKLGIQHLNELRNINLSLTCLAKVINCLSSKHSKIKPPYRQSKLTRLLKDSLGGTSRTLIIATICSAEEYLDEVISTLKFSERAQQVSSVIRKNVVMIADPESLLRLQEEVRFLREMVKRSHKIPKDSDMQINLQQLISQNQKLKSRMLSQERVNQLMHENVQMRQRIEMLTRQLKDSQSEDDTHSAKFRNSRQSNQFELPVTKKSVFQNSKSGSQKLAPSTPPPFLKPGLNSQYSKASQGQLKQLQKIRRPKQLTHKPKVYQSTILQRLQQLDKLKELERLKYDQKIKQLEINQERSMSKHLK